MTFQAVDNNFKIRTLKILNNFWSPAVKKIILNVYPKNKVTILPFL